MINAVGREVPESLTGRTLEPYRGAWANINPRFVSSKSVEASPNEKILPSIAAAIDAVGLQDG